MSTMRFRNSRKASTKISSGDSNEIGLRLEFETLKDTVWRLTCRVVYLENELAAIKERFGISEAAAHGQNLRNNRREFWSNQTADTQYSVLDSDKLTEVQTRQERVSEGLENVGPDIDVLSDISSEQEDLKTLPDSNLTSLKKERKPKIWKTVTNVSSIKQVRKRQTPRIGPDGKRIKEFACNLCDRKFIRNEHLQDHRRTHQGNCFSCITCGTTFAYRNALRRHEKDRCKIKLTPEELTCKVCRKVFQGKKNLGIHTRVHSEKKQKTEILSSTETTPTESAIDMHQNPTVLNKYKNGTQDQELDPGQCNAEIIVPNITSQIDFSDILQL